MNLPEQTPTFFGRAYDRLRSLTPRDALLPLALAGAVVFAGCTDDRPDEPVRTVSTSRPDAINPAFQNAAGYLPSYRGADEIARLEREDAFQGPKIYSFITLDEGGKFLEPESENKAVLDYFRKRTQDGEENLIAIGGWQSRDDGNKKTDEHETLLQGWDSALRDPQTFVDQLDSTFMTYSDKGINFSGISLDFEYPKEQQDPLFVELIKQIKERFPNLKIRVAVNSSDTSIYENLAENVKLIDRIDLMAYDEQTPSAEAYTTRPHPAPGVKVLEAIKNWVTLTGDAGKISVGFPFYGYEYDRVNGQYVNGRPIANRDIKGKVRIDERNMANYAVRLNNGGATETFFTSPALANRIFRIAVRQNPNLAEPFVWELTQNAPDQYTSKG